MQEDLNKALEVLRSGGTILYPTDTIWGIGCDACNSKAIEKVYKIKTRGAEKSLIILADSPEMVRNYVDELPEVAIELIETFKDPLTIIYNKARNLPRNLTAADGSIAIRIPKDEFCRQIITMLGRPITSTSANISGEPNPFSFHKISAQIKEAVDYVCVSHQTKVNAPKPSTIVKINADGQMQILRS